MRRRDFLARAGIVLGGLPLAGDVAALTPVPPPRPRAADPGDWDWVRDQFPLDRSRIHMATFLLASHPRRVADAIDRHRRGFDADPAHYWHAHFLTAEPETRAAASAYLGVDADHVALTDSTTMGLAMIYGGLVLRPGQEILTSTHDHYSTELALRFAAERAGADVRRISLYDDPATVSVDEVAGRVRRAITPRTRVLALTWVHSSTGVKLPLPEIARAVADANRGRDEADRVLFVADGVHGLGIEDVTLEALGPDVFVAGTHKWIFGPRGTGLVWARPEAWAAMRPLVPSFGTPYAVWLELMPDAAVPPADRFTPGGFHSFDHRWALGEAFAFHQEIGKARVQDRIHALNSMAKEGLAAMPHVRVHTPLAPALSAGIICFQVDGMEPTEVEAALAARGIVASTSPYRVSYPRLAPSLINNEDEVERSLAAVRALA